MTKNKELYRALWLAREAGFKFILWKGKVLDCKTCDPTGILESDLF